MIDSTSSPTSRSRRSPTDAAPDIAGGRLAIATTGGPQAVAAGSENRMSPVVDLSEYRANGAVSVRRAEKLLSRIVVPPPSRVEEDEDDLALSPWAESRGKRLFDLFFGGMALMATLPVMSAVALAIWLEDGGPIVYAQPRAGRKGRPFRFFKFRSMVRNADGAKSALQEFNESSDGVIFKMRADPRVTRVGSFLRRTSLDELPQFFHVLFGDMSLVGPRPHPVEEAAQYSEAERVRLEVKPGVTCLWQIMGRSDIPFGQQVILDRIYMQHENFLLDLKILLKTLPAVALGRGAY